MIQKLVWLALFVGLSSGLLYGAAQMGDEKASATQTVTGCLQKGVEPQGFFLISTDNKHWELYPNPGVSLADHVGHTIAVTGTLAHRSKAQEEKSQPYEQKEIGGRQH
ncbi:MAG: hypothetical protein ACLP56_12005, partial [Candidatus Sulfotelmatobacter sp.]